MKNEEEQDEIWSKEKNSNYRRKSKRKKNQIKPEYITKTISKQKLAH